MLAGFEGGFGGREVPIVGRGDADEIDAVLEELADRVGLAKADERRDRIAGRFAIGIGPAAGAAGDRGQLDLAQAKPRVIDAGRVGLLEKWPIRLVKNHPHADHAGAELVFAVENSAAMNQLLKWIHKRNSSITIIVHIARGDGQAVLPCSRGGDEAILERHACGPVLLMIVRAWQPRFDRGIAHAIIEHGAMHARPVSNHVC